MSEIGGMLSNEALRSMYRHGDVDVHQMRDTTMSVQTVMMSACEVDRSRNQPMFPAWVRGILVCRQWNEEASGVFFSGNMFAFDDCLSMEHFFSVISEHWKMLITKVSLLLPLWHTDDDSTSVDILAASLSVLSNLTWLQYLELDAKLLNDEATKSALLDIHIPSLERVCFVVQSPINVVPWREGLSLTHIWGELANRYLLVGGLPEHVVRSIKAQSIDAPHFPNTNKEEIRRQRQLYEFVQKNDQLWEIKGFGRTILDCEAQKTDPPND
jgi:hypothetical protein